MRWMMTLSLADKVRAVALLKYVGPAKKAGSVEFSIAVKDLLKDLESVDFPLNYTPLVCNSIRTKSFQRENHLEITRVDGPKSQTGTRVVVHYRVLNEDRNTSSGSTGKSSPTETSRDRAKRLVGELRGLLKNEIAQYGGAEGFMRWVRGHDEDAG
jgi:bisphosphoglycerate-dependent phosphoglycerate mutase